MDGFYYEMDTFNSKNGFGDSAQESVILMSMPLWNKKQADTKKAVLAAAVKIVVRKKEQKHELPEEKKFSILK